MNEDLKGIHTEHHQKNPTYETLSLYYRSFDLSLFELVLGHVYGH
ncbi:hypothetical protein GCM10022278_30320 [Allohahella marinimesophila]|uniref:Uncharacterized protein n=1 Tax=Allohahella marinimesophila TaxID=1054972 RepID=A0ABP7PSW2_9GAMM